MSNLQPRHSGVPKSASPVVDREGHHHGDWRYGDMRTRQRKNGIYWYVDATIDLPNGTRRDIRETTGCLASDFAQAEIECQRIIEREKANLPKAKNAPMLFGEWVAIWRRDWERHNTRGNRPISERTVTGHTTNLRPLLEFFKHTTLQELEQNPGKILAYKSWRAEQPKVQFCGNKGLVEGDGHPAINTITRDLQVLKAILSGAVADRRIVYHPFKTLPQLKNLTITAKANCAILTAEQQETILRAADPELRRLIEIILGTSFRIGGILNLGLDYEPVPMSGTGEDVKQYQGLPRGVFPILQAVSKNKLTRLPITPTAFDAFLEQVAAVRANLPGRTQLFPYAYSTVRDRFIGLSGVVGFHVPMPHELRKTFITRVRSGRRVPIEDMGLLTGHSRGSVAAMVDGFYDKNDRDEMAYRTLAAALPDLEQKKEKKRAALRRVK